MTLSGLAVIAGIVWFGNYERQTAMVILAVALAKGIETLSDIHYGLFQLNDRLDQTGRSMMLRGVLSVAALSAGLYLTHNIVWGCAALALVWLAALVVFDMPRGRRFAAGVRPDRAQFMEPDLDGAAAGDCDHHGGAQSQYAALFHPHAAWAKSSSGFIRRWRMPRWR